MASLIDPSIRELLEGRYIASLASRNSDGTIHMVAVWYLFEDGQIYIATSSRSRKARNLQANATVSVMIDSRDPAASRGTNVAGTASLITGETAQHWNARVHSKYLSAAALADPRIAPVFSSFDDVTIQIKPESLIYWDMRKIDQQFLGGAMAGNPSYLLDLQR
jgi:PPOX class probable F420-dependent enzyme